MVNNNTLDIAYLGRFATTSSSHRRTFLKAKRSSTKPNPSRYILRPHILNVEVFDCGGTRYGFKYKVIKQTV